MTASKSKPNSVYMLTTRDQDPINPNAKQLVLFVRMVEMPVNKPVQDILATMNSVMKNIVETLAQLDASLGIEYVHMPVVPHVSYATDWQTDAATLMVYGLAQVYRWCSVGRHHNLKTIKRYHICCSSDREASLFSET